MLLMLLLAMTLCWCDVAYVIAGDDCMLLWCCFLPINTTCLINTFRVVTSSMKWRNDQCELRAVGHRVQPTSTLAVLSPHCVPGSRLHRLYLRYCLSTSCGQQFRFCLSQNCSSVRGAEQRCASWRLHCREEDSSRFNFAGHKTEALPRHISVRTVHI